jgi:hypothetical protein
VTTSGWIGEKPEETKQLDTISTVRKVENGEYLHPDAFRYAT